MTEKELLYLEDILNHIKDLKEISEYYTEDVDNNLEVLLQNVVNTSNQQYNKILNLL